MPHQQFQALASCNGPPAQTPPPRVQGEGRDEGPRRTLRLEEAPPHRAEFWSSSVPSGPLPARGARNAVLRRPVGEGADEAVVQDAGVWPRLLGFAALD